MPLGHSASGGDLDDAIRRVQDSWVTVGFNTVDDQPVRQPTEAELTAVIDALAEATKAAKAMQKAMA